MKFLKRAQINRALGRVAGKLATLFYALERKILKDESNQRKIEKQIEGIEARLHSFQGQLFEQAALIEDERNRSRIANLWFREGIECFKDIGSRLERAEQQLERFGDAHGSGGGSDIWCDKNEGGKEC